MLRQVRGLGTLAPTSIRWIPAATEGRVEQILVLPGSPVKATSILLELSNPQLREEALDAGLKLRAAQADYKKLEVLLSSQVLAQQAETAHVQAEYSQAKMQADVDTELAKAGVTAELAHKFSATKAQELFTRREIEEQRLASVRQVLEAQLQAQRAYVDQYRALATLKANELQGLKVPAGIAGVLQEQPLKVGQWVTAGTNLAKVAQPENLKAELKIPETEARDVQVGQTASVDTHNGVVSGHVTRVDPSVQNGTVTVEIGLEGVLPRGARPDLSVDGTIDLERVADVLYVGRPAFGQEQSTVGIFRIESDGKTAVRVPVRLGRTSVNSVEILQGLREGDQVILSDMSRWDNVDRIRLD